MSWRMRMKSNLFLMVILSLTACFSGCGGQNSSNSKSKESPSISSQKDKGSKSLAMFGYISAATRELHLITAEGHPLINYHPVHVDQFKITKNFIAYLTENKLHMLDMEGQPMAGYKPINHVGWIYSAS